MLASLVPSLLHKLPAHRGSEILRRAYQGGAALPRISAPWFECGHEDDELDEASLRAYCADRPWAVPQRPLLFLCDIHADREALIDSLAAGGAIEPSESLACGWRVTDFGRKALVVLGGDCFDKGPSTLELLRELNLLLAAGIEIELLAGNHDLRTLLGLQYMGRRESRFAHLFVRMGQKTVPLFAEIYERYVLSGGDHSVERLSEAQAREILFPDRAWYEKFEEAAGDLIRPDKLTKELRRIAEKEEELSAACRALGMSLSDLHVAGVVARRLFLEPGGEFHWYFARTQLVRRWGSYLLVHGGVDDSCAAVLAEGGAQGLNDWYSRLLAEDPFELYNGPVGNCFRTKYRPEDYPLTRKGTDNLRRAGIYALVHGHKNVRKGQRMVLREGVLNFECDCSVDRNTRRNEKLSGAGAAVTIFAEDGAVYGLSADDSRLKVFDPAMFAPALMQY